MEQRFLRLSGLMTGGREAERPVAFDSDRRFDWGSFAGHVAGLSKSLAAAGGRGLEPGPGTYPGPAGAEDVLGAGGRPCPDASGSALRPGRWLLACESSYAFAVGLVSLWQTGGTAVLPPNLQPGSLAEDLGALRGAVTDMRLDTGGRPRLDPLGAPSKTAGWVSPERSFAAVELRTSGSSGERKSVRKTMAQIEDEVAVLEGTFGDRIRGCAVFATVSHQHIFGFLFRVLWPLCAGRPFFSGTPLLWDELIRAMGDHGETCLVTSPAHLDRVGAVDGGAFRRAGCRALFSSGGALKPSTARKALGELGVSPIDVYGSTETGGLGWREPAAGAPGEAWRPFDGVELAVADDGRLLAKSGLVDPADLAGDGWFRMGDLGEVLADGRFRVKGRADRIVKIADLRVSLPEMERRLEEHPLVERCALILLREGPAPGRSVVGAAVVLAEEGRGALSDRGRAEPGATLRAHLRERFDQVAVPRVWRYVAQLPMDSQSKISVAALERLFGPVHDPSAGGAELLERRVVGSGLQLRLKVPEDLLYLEGHFPGLPVVPGVVQVKWALEAARGLLEEERDLVRMEVLKFGSLLRPGREFLLKIEPERGEAETKVRFSAADPSGDPVYASGRLILGEGKAL